jgi:hypothetical protein
MPQLELGLVEKDVLPTVGKLDLCAGSMRTAMCLF